MENETMAAMRQLQAHVMAQDFAIKMLIRHHPDRGALREHWRTASLNAVDYMLGTGHATSAKFRAEMTNALAGFAESLDIEE